MFVQSSVCFPETIAERRTAKRWKPTRETTCRLIADSGAILGIGLVWNISVSGVSLLSSVDLGSGQDADIEIIGNGSALRVGVHIVHHGVLNTGDFMIGAQFDRSLNEEELHPFVLEGASV